MSYIGSTPTTQSFIAGTDYFNGDGSTVAFTLSRSVVSVNDIEVVINNVEQQPNTAYTVSGTTITFTSAPSAGTGNIYVRYLSTTTQSITPSQNTVSYSTLNSDNQSKLGISFKNRIINGAMVIDQRNAGASVATSNGSGVYTLDRWQAQYALTSKFTVQQNAGSVTPPVGFSNYLGITSTSSYSIVSTSYYALTQAIEGYNVADLNWGSANAKTVTLSFWVRSSLTGTFGGALQNSAQDRSYPFAYTISAANTWEQKTITVAGDTSGTWLTTNGTGIYLQIGLGLGSFFSGTAGAWASGNYISSTGATSVVGTSGATFYLTGVQFEVGTQATTFDYRSIGTELDLCQRYYNRYTASASYTAYGIASISSASTFRATITFPAMRTIPTITQSNLGINIGPQYGISSNNTFYVGTNTAWLDFNIGSASLTGTIGVWNANNNGAGYIDFSAEL